MQLATTNAIALIGNTVRVAKTDDEAAEWLVTLCDRALMKSLQLSNRFLGVLSNALVKTSFVAGDKLTIWLASTSRCLR